MLEIGELSPSLGNPLRLNVRGRPAEADEPPFHALRERGGAPHLWPSLSANSNVARRREASDVRFWTSCRKSAVGQVFTAMPDARHRHERSTSSQYMKNVSSKPPNSSKTHLPTSKQAPAAHGVVSV